MLKNIQVYIINIQYNSEVIDILTNRTLTLPDGEVVKPNLSHTTNWIYQGNIPIILPEGLTIDDVIVTETSNYAYMNYNFDLETTFSTDYIGRLDYQNELQRREKVNQFLEFFYTYDIKQTREVPINMFPHIVRISNQKSYFENGELVIPTDSITPQFALGRLNYTEICFYEGCRLEKTLEFENFNQISTITHLFSENTLIELRREENSKTLMLGLRGITRKE